MCGIAGILNLFGAPVDHDVPLRMISTLLHRGPDAHGIYCCGGLALGHSRLSILDLDGGKQPMSTHDGRLTITFNGEIFNYIELRETLRSKGHSFRTRSDTEVILHAYREYGEDCVQHFNGQWAFAIWDAAPRKLFLSRDRAGIRPLYYARTPTSFLFASEIKALLASGAVAAELDLCGLDQIFTLWVTIAPRTTFRNVLQLPPGCSMLVQDGEIHVRNYWSQKYGDVEEFNPATEPRLAEELLGLLHEATRIRLRSDVPVGAYLSGGIDSTVTTALARQIVQDRLRSFSITFEDAEYNEKAYQDQASHFLGTQHCNLHCSSADIAEVFPEVIRHTEQPILRAAPAPMYMLSKLVRDSGYKVVLTGEGADEVLGGYDIFKEAKIRRFWARVPESSLRPLLLRRLYPYMEAVQRQPAPYLRHFFRVTPEDLASPFFSHLPRWELTARIKLLLSDEIRMALKPYDLLADLEHALPSEYAQWTYFARAEYLEYQYLMPGYILSSQGDRMAMSHSVEGRYPFLDYRVMDFAARLPAQTKMKALDQKHLLKKACRGLIPESILHRAKQPYRAPDGQCFFNRGPVDYVQDLLSPDAISRDGIFDAHAVSVLTSKFRNGRPTGVRDNMALVAVLSTQLLVHHFIHNANEVKGLCAQPILNGTYRASSSITSCTVDPLS